MEIMFKASCVFQTINNDDDDVKLFTATIVASNRIKCDGR
jgi:hypothetical protein